jgi:ribosome-associated toxin RatA of RatAB toxin-antitoxin module
MREVKRSALVALPPGRVYALINAIEQYPQFVPGCKRAVVESRSEREIVATLVVGRGALQTEFTTRNELEPEHRIHMRLVRGPFRMLEGEWRLTGLGEGGCRIDLEVRFAFSNPIKAALFEPFFQETVGSLIDAFVQRARTLGST